MLQKNRGDSGILEGVIFFVSLRFYFSLIFSIDYCQNSQYLQGFVGSGIRQKAIDTKLNTLPIKRTMVFSMTLFSATNKIYNHLFCSLFFSDDSSLPSTSSPSMFSKSIWSGDNTRLLFSELPSGSFWLSIFFL